jgi:hypothetical protein
MALAISTRQPFSEVKTWTDREVDTAWKLVHDAQKEAERDTPRKSEPGAGGPQYSG